jgi:hypothetical protein
MEHAEKAKGFRVFRLSRVLRRSLSGFINPALVGAALAIHQIATVEDFEILRRAPSFQFKYGCCGDGDWRKTF